MADALDSAVSPLEALAHAAALLPGVARATVDAGEVVVHAEAGSLIAILTALRDDGQFAFEQMMDLCGVDFPERPMRFDVVYNLLSVSRNQRIRVVVQTDGINAVPSIHPSCSALRQPALKSPGRYCLALAITASIAVPCASGSSACSCRAFWPIPPWSTSWPRPGSAGPSPSRPFTSSAC